jgi:hypothetical protein
MNPPPDNDPVSTPRLELDTVCELLANATRRATLLYFVEHETDVAELAELVEHIHADVEAVTTLDQARRKLAHQHLPKLADHGVIEYDERSETVRYWDGERLETLLVVGTDDHPQ